jgi:hypothetical protein
MGVSCATANIPTSEKYNFRAIVFIENKIYTVK